MQVNKKLVPYYTGSCINTIVLLRRGTELLETCRGFK